MTQHKDLLIQARDALENHAGNYKLTDAQADVHLAAIAALQAAIDEPEPEPVGWLYDWHDDYDSIVNDWFSSDYDESHSPTMGCHNIRSLYTRPDPGQCRIELVTALHGLASDFENSLYAFGKDYEALKKAKGDIAHAMGVAARWNSNGERQPAPAKPLTDDQWLEYLLRHADKSVLHVAAFVGGSIQNQGKWVLQADANNLRKLVEAAHGITEVKP